jgi:hypothetical protein
VASTSSQASVVDDGPRGAGRRLGMVGIGPTQHVARVLDHRMLEAAAGAQEGDACSRAKRIARSAPSMLR